MKLNYKNHNTNNSFGFRVLLLLVTFISITLLIEGCASTKAKETTKTPIKTELKPQPVIPQENPNIVKARKLIKGGTLENLLEAVSILKKNNLINDKKGKELIFLSQLFFKILYPNLKDREATKNIYSVKISTYSGKYSQLAEEIKKGKPIPSNKLSMDSKDFFELIIPSLILMNRKIKTFSIGYLEDLNKMIKKAQNLNSESFIPQYLNSIVYKRENTTGDEILSLQETLKLYPEYYPAKLRLAEILLATEKKENMTKALTLLLDVQKKRTEDADFLKLLAKAYINNGKYEEASNTVARAIVLSPQDTSLLLLRGMLLEKENKWEKALKVFNLVLLRDKRNKKALLEKAKVLGKLGENRKALNLLYSAEKQYPDDPAFPELRGSILLSESKDDEGLKALNKALKIDPGRVSTLRLLLKNAIKMKRWMQGAIYLSRILEKSNREEDIFMAYTVFKNLGDTDQTLTYARKLYNLKTKEEYVYYYADALHKSGKDKEAMKVINKNLKNLKDPGVKSNLYLLKGLMSKDKNRELALNFFRHALFENPDNFEALLQISYIYISKNQLRRASLYLKQAVRLRPHNPGLKIQLKQIEDRLR